MRRDIAPYLRGGGCWKYFPGGGGNAGKITMVGFDLLPQTADFVKNGVVSFTISQNPEEQGYQAVKVLHDFLTGGTEITGVDTGAQFITLDNLGEATVEG